MSGARHPTTTQADLLPAVKLVPVWCNELRNAGTVENSHEGKIYGLTLDIGLPLSDAAAARRRATGRRSIGGRGGPGSGLAAVLS